MPDLDLAEDSVALVLRGHFNPAIPTPAWFLAQGLIGQEDAIAVETELMVPQISAFHLPWAKVEVTEDRFAVQTGDTQHFERCRDLVVGTFAILAHTPVNALGINRSVHLRMPSLDAWHALGDYLVPKDPWEGIMRLPGVASLQIQGVRPDEYGGYVIFRFEPSNRFEQSIYLEHNDHFNLDTGVTQPTDRSEFRREVVAISPPTPERLATALAILSKNFQESLARAESIMRSIARTARNA